MRRREGGKTDRCEGGQKRMQACRSAASNLALQGMQERSQTSDNGRLMGAPGGCQKSQRLACSKGAGYSGPASVCFGK